MANRKTLIAGNWKMNTTADEAIKLAGDIAKEIPGLSHQTDFLICPPFVWLNTVAGIVKNTDVKLGAQNMYWEDKGAYTGEISPAMIKSAGCEYVILGHSERRQYFGETDQTINKKLNKAIESSLIPVVCLGESLDIRESGKTNDVITEQFKECFRGFTQYDGIILAYEPVWAIGTGKTATPEQAQEVHKLLRDLLKSQTDGYNKVRLLYGGSVKPGNAGELIIKEDIDGFLVGGASLKAADFIGIAKAAAPQVTA
ncbi:MAG: triose-phosphate isomerase [candidate division Zixibacteria bacterium]|nr:triose-phosphate isomerase [candidate division Zixibacteria bacterium]